MNRKHTLYYLIIYFIIICFSYAQAPPPIKKYLIYDDFSIPKKLYPYLEAKTSKTNRRAHAILHETLYEGKKNKIIKKGAGKSPSSSMDQVRVHYEGKLIDGTIFDSSYEKGEPYVTRLNQVIKGWTEGVQLMKEGSEYEFFIHPRLAYGERRNNNIPPNSVLLFKIELQKVFDKNIK